MAMDEKGLTVKRRGKTETIRAIIVAVGVSESERVSGPGGRVSVARLEVGSVYQVGGDGRWAFAVAGTSSWGVSYAGSSCREDGLAVAGLRGWLVGNHGISCFCYLLALLPCWW
jgi:hypothetical protein